MLNNKIPNLNLDANDIAILSAALNVFVSNTIDGVSQSVKAQNNILAKSVMTKLTNKQTNFNAEDLRIMYVSLFNFQIIINEANEVSSNDFDVKFINDSKKYLLIIDSLMNKIKLVFESNGIHID